MPKLEIGATYKFVVSDMKKEVTSFASSAGGGGLKYCHGFTAQDENGEKYSCQIVSDYESITLNLGDFLRLTVKKFTKNVYTVENINVENMGGMAGSVKVNHDQPSAPKPVAQPNPMIAGTIADRSLSYAITYCGLPNVPFVREDDCEEVLRVADEFHAWLSGKLNNFKS